MQVFLTGATGYIGGRLAPRLLTAGHTVRCLARDPRKLNDRPWADLPGLEIVPGDVENEDRLAEQMAGCRAAYYLVHSMIAAGDDYAEHDRRLARSFARAAAKAGVERIIYLGGLGETGEHLSRHLVSRREVERILSEGEVPVTTFRAAMIIGSGSASFEILRYLVEHLPVMITPRWVRTECQPIAVRNVLHYLTACLDTPKTTGRGFDIGGPDVMTYRKLMTVMAEERGLPRRLVIPVPVLTPKLSSLWIHLVTPIESRIARPLAEGLRNRVVCRETEATRLMPQRLLSVREAIDAALGKIAAGAVETSWSSAGPMPGDPDWAGGLTFRDARTEPVRADPRAAFAAVCKLGGETGYHGAGWMWALRGLMDRLVGGPGLRRGRRHPSELAYGDAVDFWRVTALDPGKLLELRAEMRVPGEASLRFEVQEAKSSGGAAACFLTQTALFKPKGLLGLLYWYAVLPVHGLVFRTMLRGIARDAENAAGQHGASQASG